MLIPHYRTSIFLWFFVATLGAPLNAQLDSLSVSRYLFPPEATVYLLLTDFAGEIIDEGIYVSDELTTDAVFLDKKSHSPEALILTAFSVTELLNTGTYRVEGRSICGLSSSTITGSDFRNFATLNQLRSFGTKNRKEVFITNVPRRSGYLINNLSAAKSGVINQPYLAYEIPLSNHGYYLLLENKEPYIIGDVFLTLDELLLPEESIHREIDLHPAEDVHGMHIQFPDESLSSEVFFKAIDEEYLKVTSSSGRQDVEIKYFSSPFINEVLVLGHWVSADKIPVVCQYEGPLEKELNLRAISQDLSIDLYADHQSLAIEPHSGSIGGEPSWILKYELMIPELVRVNRKRRYPAQNASAITKVNRRVARINYRLNYTVAGGFTAERQFITLPDTDDILRTLGLNRSNRSLKVARITKLVRRAQ
ncbi:hypothetical protein [Lewinella sp. W8]|uniref:hypothetical protein n=1 Tax=Lewinella sp. W8 TaxID=2528208 RepID=UPI001068387C|nr:hypothetical protein [Lewinella sp. W8]MTB53106.1 hypothetical protein [Lewinella sp. W8]